MKNGITRSQVKNIGKKLRAALGLQDEDLRVLNEWRAHHGASLSYYADLLKNIATKINIAEQDYTVIQRLKRVHSIILKLKRFPDMQLSMMEDIAGIRIVLPSIKDVFKLADMLKDRKTKHELTKFNNYISSPKTDGYRSLHFIYRIEKTPTILIEIQVRSQLQHIWATGVEVFGTLEATSFKTGEGAKDWKEFFKLLSSHFAIKEGFAVTKEHEIYSSSQIEQALIKKIRKLNIIEQLNVYTSAYTSSWRSKRGKGRSGKYALLILNSLDNSTKVQLYAESKFNEALKDYSAIEKKYHSSNELNVVLVNLANMDKLEQAYPNYFMDTRELSRILSEIILGKLKT